MTSLAPSARPALESKLRSLLVQAVSDTGYTYGAIARRAGLHVSTVTKMMSGERAGSVDSWDLVLAAADIDLVAVLR